MYQFLVIIVAFSAFAHFQNAVSPDFSREVKVSSSVDDIVAYVEDLREAVKARADDARVTSWECTSQGNANKGNGNNNKCAAYTRIVLDDGLVDPATWESELVPDYYYLPKWPDNWGFSLFENAVALRVCLAFPYTSENNRISKTLIRSYPGLFKIGQACDHGPTMALTSNEVDAFTGEMLFVTSNLVEK